MRQGFELIKYLVIRCLGDKLHKFLLLWNCNLLNINGIKNKLGDRDSNPDTTVQSRMSCRWTIPQ